MITGLNKKNRKNDIIALSILIVVFLFITWLCTPPGNKFAQMCFWGNNTKYFVAKYIKHENVEEYLLYRDNAIYLAQMEDKKAALESIDKSIDLIPTYAGDAELEKLYKYKAQILFYFKDYKGAANSYLKSNNLGIIDSLKMAISLKILGKNKYAIAYCNNIIDQNERAYAGYACLADVYASVGKYDVSVRLYDLLIEKAPNHAQYYKDRADYRKKSGDTIGFEEDIEKVKKLNSTSLDKASIIEKTVNAKGFVLSEV